MNLIKIKNKMCQLELTQEDLAKECGVHYSTVFLWIEGKRVPRKYNKIKLANALEMTLDELESQNEIYDTNNMAFNYINEYGNSHWNTISVIRNCEMVLLNYCLTIY